MYHISEEVRAKKSAMRICEAVMDCAKRKPLADITVAELYRDYLISRTTFYRLFDNIADVVEYQCDQMAQEIFLNIKGNSTKEILLEMIRALMAQKEVVEVLSRNGRIGMVKTMQEKYLSKSLLAIGLDEDWQSESFHSILAALVPAMMDTWVRNGQKESPEEIYEILQENLQAISNLVGTDMDVFAHR